MGTLIYKLTYKILDRPLKHISETTINIWSDSFKLKYNCSTKKFHKRRIHSKELVTRPRSKMTSVECAITRQQRTNGM